MNIVVHTLAVPHRGRLDRIGRVGQSAQKFFYMDEVYGTAPHLHAPKPFYGEYRTTVFRPLATDNMYPVRLKNSDVSRCL